MNVENFYMSDATVGDVKVNEDQMREFVEKVRERAKNLPKSAIENSKPKQAIQALIMMGAGKSFAEIRRVTKLSYEAMKSLEWNHGETIESKRKEYSVRFAVAASQFTDLLFLKAERMLDDPDQLDKVMPDKLALTAAVMTDKAMQLAGMATSTVEIRKGASIDDAKEELEAIKRRVAMRARAGAIEAEVVTESE